MGQKPQVERRGAKRTDGDKREEQVKSGRQGKTHRMQSIEVQDGEAEEQRVLHYIQDMMIHTHKRSEARKAGVWAEIPSKERQVDQERERERGC